MIRLGRSGGAVSVMERPHSQTAQVSGGPASPELRGLIESPSFPAGSLTTPSLFRGGHEAKRSQFRVSALHTGGTQSMFISFIPSSIWMLKTCFYVFIKRPPSKCRIYLYPSHRLPWWLSGKESIPMQERQVQFLGLKDPLEYEIATHSSILAGIIPRIEEPGGLQSTGSQRVRHGSGWTTVPQTSSLLKPSPSTKHPFIQPTQIQAKVINKNVRANESKSLMLFIDLCRQPTAWPLLPSSPILVTSPRPLLSPATLRWITSSQASPSLSPLPHLSHFCPTPSSVLQVQPGPFLESLLHGVPHTLCSFSI